MSAWSERRAPGRSSGVSSLLVGLLSMALAGCVTLGRFEELETRVIELEKQNSTLREKTDIHESRLENLNTILKRSEADLREGYAATTSTVDELDERMRRTLGALESTQYQLERDSKLLQRVTDLLDKQFGTTLSALPDNLPQDAEKLYVMGNERLNAAKWREARAIFREYLNRDAQGPRAADSQLGIGESFVGEKDYERALGEFKAVWAAYKDSPRAPLALLRIAEVLVLQGQCAKAKQVYELLIREAPKSDAAAKAKVDVKAVGAKCK